MNVMIVTLWFSFTIRSSKTFERSVLIKYMDLIEMKRKKKLEISAKMGFSSKKISSQRILNGFVIGPSDQLLQKKILWFAYSFYQNLKKTK